MYRKSNTIRCFGTFFSLFGKKRTKVGEKVLEKRTKAGEKSIGKTDKNSQKSVGKTDKRTCGIRKNMAY